MRHNGSLVAGLATVLLALLLTLLAIPVTVVTSYIPSSVTSHELVWILILAAGGIAAAVMTWLQWRSASDHDAVVEQVAVSDPPIVVGEIPREPPAFVDRAAVGMLAAAVESGRAAVVCAVTGLRGVGKTQVAAAYARSRIEHGWDLIGWVNAESPDVLLTDLVRVAKALGVADPEGDSAESACRLRDHLESWPGLGLVVFDNVGDPDVLRPYLPAAGGTQLVVTSTDKAFADWGVPVDVPEFMRAESVGYLAERTGLEDESFAAAVAEELGDLPLALAQAATTINRRHWTYERYLTELVEVPVDKLVGHAPGQAYTRSAAAALLLSVQAAEDADQTGSTGLLLRIVAVLSPDGVPRDLLKGLRFTRSGGLDAALELCVVASLLTWSVVGDGVIMHRLLGRVLRERDQEAGHWFETVEAALDAVEPLLFAEEQALFQRAEGTELAVQIEALWDVYDAGGMADSALAGRLLRARSWTVQHLTAAADVGRAVTVGILVLADAIRVLGEDDPDTLASRSRLAYAYLSAWRLQEAIPLYERTLADSIRVFGEDRPDTLTSRSNLAYAYRYAGRLGEAIPLYERTVADRERVLGEDHPDTLTSQNSLANAYLYAGRLGEAIPLYERTVADRERVLGEDHPDTVTSRDNLAAAYEAERLSEPILLYEQNLADCVRLLGQDHPDTRAARNNLAGIYKLAERPGKAILLYEQSLADCVRLLGQDHPDTLTARNILAGTYRFAGRHGEAILLYEQSLADCVRILGQEHPDALAARNNLAYAYRLTGRLAEAITLYEQVFADRTRVLGEYHPDTLTSRNNLAAAYELTGRSGEAIPPI